MFLNAKPIWVEGKECEVNCRVQFKALCPRTENAEIHIATSGIYNLFINGEFVSYGPARAGKNHFRMEKFDISRYLTEDENTVVIEVAGYYCSNFYIMQQPSFLQAEIVVSNSVVVYSGRDFTARINPYYIQKTQRYSFQRTFAECYRNVCEDCFLTDTTVGDCVLVETEKKTVIERSVPYPQFERLDAEYLFSGSMEKKIPEKYVYDRYLWKVGFKDGISTGWPISELECIPEKEWQEMSFTPIEGGDFKKISANGYNIYSFAYNATGMISLKVKCKNAGTVYLAFDEIIEGKALNPRRMRCGNIIPFELKEGEYLLKTFEVYTMKYLQITAVGTDIEVDEIEIIEYKAPPVEVPQFDDEKLQLIADAAVETYRQNAVDIFTDCPSRERAGWLCDSFFLARTEHALTGENVVEEAFLENFLHEESYGKLPKGMFPMCYPSDHASGWYIPNWAMWLVAELSDYKKRTGKTEIIERYKNKVYELLNFFAKFENSDGLLENLQAWVFVEWSRANDNDMVQGVNYPSNMMYFVTLKAAAELYDDEILSVKAEKLKQKINEQAFDGKFFVDHATRTANGLFAIPESTEVCQYYAFFSGVATPETHPELFKTLIEDFGPERDMMTVYPTVHKAAPFIGNYLRLDILKNNGFDDVVEKNIKGYFHYMAQRTGTLWEKAETSASCNHGFASCVLYWLS